MSSRDDPFFEGKLLPEFGPTPPEAWHEKLEDDLGNDWRERLRSGGALDALPFYRAEDLDDVPTGTPGARPGWEIRHDLAAEDPGDARREIERVVGDGAPPERVSSFVEALGLPARLLENGDVLPALLADVDPRETALHLDGPPACARRLFAEASPSPDGPRGTLTFDPAARRLQHEGFDAEGGYRRLADLLKSEAGRVPAFRLVTADARPFHNAGAGVVPSLALALAAMSEHLARLTDEGVPAETVADHAQMALPVGTRFFPEIARLRAARRLFVQLAGAYGVDETPRLRLHAETAWRPVTLYDPHLNLLRGATAGAMAAVLGGADGLAVRPFDDAQDAPGDFGRRLSLNAQHILREEAHLGRVADPAAGSYYAEVLTDRLARRAWERFQNIEASGGLLVDLRKGRVQERLANARSGRDDALRHRERVRVGTNQYPRLAEERLGDAPDDDRVAPRETDAFERLRLVTERYVQQHAHVQQHATERPAAFLLPVGSPKVRSARANFARNALGCAGFRAVEHVGFDTAEAGVKAAAEAVASGNAQLVACAAPDEEYAALVPAVRQALGDADVPVVVAGRPDALPEEQRDAADAFLHRGMDLLETLEALQERLGIARHGSAGARERGGG
jgi:methylmalonyl-CoA mutase